MKKLISNGMLDIAIPKLLDTFASSEAIERFVHKHITITEKFDGTKLTFLKTGLKKEDWILAYKGHILSRTLLQLLVNSEILDRSVGISQYGVPVDHFSSSFVDTEAIRVGTEVFIEFIQKKPTVLCDYKKTHSMFMIACRNVKWHIDNTGTRLTTFHDSDINDALAATYRAALRLEAPPVLFQGRLCDPAHVGSKLTPARPSTKHFEGRWNDYLAFLKVSLSDFESALGGKPEGVVIRTEDGDMMKVVRDDQCNRKLRQEKKKRWQCVLPDDEKRYWDWIRNASQLSLTIVKKMLRTPQFCGEHEMTCLAIVAAKWETFLVSHVLNTPPLSPRHRVNIADDIMLTAKLMNDRHNWLGDAEYIHVGIIAMAGKPVHRGHWELIRQASAENDRVMLVVSTCDREEISGSDMFSIWCDILQTHLPENVLLRFSDSPYTEVMNEMKGMLADNDNNISFNVYSDCTDIEKMWSPVVLNKKFGRLAKQIATVAVSREMINVSGTEMRQYLRDRNRDLFFLRLPEQLTRDECESVWQLLIRNN